MTRLFTNVGDLIVRDRDLGRVAIIDLGGDEGPREFTFAQLDAPHADYTEHVVRLAWTLQTSRNRFVHDADAAGINSLLHERPLHKARRDHDMVRLGVLPLGLLHEARVCRDLLLAKLRVLRLQQLCLGRHMHRPHLQDRRHAASLRPAHGVQRRHAPAIEQGARAQPTARKSVEPFGDMPRVPGPAFDDRRVAGDVRQIAQRPETHEADIGDLGPPDAVERHERDHPLEQSLALQIRSQPQWRWKRTADGDRHAERRLLALTPIGRHYASGLADQ